MAEEARDASPSPEADHAVNLATAKVTAAVAQLKCDNITAAIAGHDDKGSEEVGALKTDLVKAGLELEYANGEVSSLSSSSSSSPSPDSSSEEM